MPVTNEQLSPPAMMAMHALEHVREVKIKEQVRALEAISALLGAEIEMANQYDVIDNDTNEPLFFIAEQTDCLTMQLKQCLPDCAPWSAHMLYKDQVAFKMEREWKCVCCCFNRPVVTISDEEGNEVGSVVDPCTCCSLRFHAQDADGEDIFTVNGGCCQLGLFCPMPCGPCAKVHFTIEDDEGEEVGEITKKLTCMKWLAAPDADNYKIEFDKVSDPAHKVILMGLAIFLDFKYFNDNSRDDNGGLLGGAMSD
eukprot:TRINITY_DN116462_c0_g1_i1.p1 TRINITY_DN116462_c0_g1~~TRINITY_DN116462_c0_g1_i1.p1  ORF type:complete len:254 (+),score=67.74 TRINITY_DN116462_c0_g1_i1:62-823(+)